jgi:SAM-dependent methyltransferase
MVATCDTADTGVVSRSFRDPAGTVLRSAGRILRAVEPGSVGELENFLATQAARDAIEAGKLVTSVRLTLEEAANLHLGSAAIFEHERIPFPSYAHEWPPEMLAAAGTLTLELFRRALREGFGLKDATPYNILFRGPRPVFVDVLSFEHRQPRDASWRAYAQFVRTFLLPLAAHRHFGMSPADTFAGKRDGLEPSEFYHWAGFWKRLTPPLLSLVTMPKWMGNRASAETYHPKPAASPEQAQFILDHLLRSCERQLKSLAPRPNEDSVWTGYLDHKSLYSTAQLEAKEHFVREALDLAGPRTVLDVGANEGRFSLLAAQRTASVVAVDSDPAVVGTIWRHAGAQNLDVLPLVVDLTRPTPAIGWRNQECDSFLQRARGQFDMVMMLAVLHHMLVTERVPLDELLSLAADLTRDYLLIEFVAPADPMFQRIVRGREALYGDLTFERFEAAAASRFERVKSLKIEGLHRCLYLFRLRRPVG